LPLDLAECSSGVDRHIRVEPITDGGDGRKSRADFERDAGEDQLLGPVASMARATRTEKLSAVVTALQHRFGNRLDVRHQAVYASFRRQVLAWQKSPLRLSHNVCAMNLNSVLSDPQLKCSLLV